jgi:dephospho-CoA kinase
MAVSRWGNKYVIGLTGNIAVGKSVVRQMMQHLGAYTIDADSLSHRAMAPGAPAYKPVVDTFGQFILDADKNIDRKALGNIVFGHPEALAKLEAIVHPIVTQAIATLVTKATQQVVVIEAIKLLEAMPADAIDEVWVVDAAPKTQYIRLVQGRKLTEDEARKRITAQSPQATKLAKATTVIKNDGNVEETWKQVQQAWTTGVATKLKPAAPAAPPPAAAPAPAPAAPAPAAPAPAAPTAPAAPPAPAPAAPSPAPAAPAAAPEGVSIKRGMPSNAELIANFINKATNKSVNRMDIMMAFGQKSYLLAQDSADKILALMGWQVENLITRVDEFYLTDGVQPEPIVQALVVAIEQASKDLQSEVGFVFLPTSALPSIVQTFQQNGYETTTVEQIKIPAWREAIQEMMTPGNSLQILTKKLREDRVLKPI